MNSYQIEAILSKNAVTKRHFMGVFPADKIPNMTLFPASLVVNLDPAREEGSHWIAMYITAPNKMVYFDSFSLDIDGKIQKFVNGYDHVTTNKRIYQNPLSSVCGHYCIVFLYFMSNNVPFIKFLDMLDAIGPDTDMYVQMFVDKMLK
jgi:hypothetical protein